MTISVVCPHCETRFQLNPDLVGKAMRCPNADCQEVFEVRAELALELPPAPPAAPQVYDAEPMFERPAAPSELPFERIESQPLGPLDAIPIDEPASVYELPFDGETLPVRTAEAVQRLPEKPASSIPAAAPIPKATLLPPPIPTAKKLSGPKEVVWSGQDPPAGAPSTAESSDDDGPYRRKRRKTRTWPKLLLAGLGIGVLGLAIFIVVGLLRQSALREEQLATEAETTYKDGNYPSALKKYEELLEKFPDSPDAKKYQFFAKIAELQAAVGSVTARENPAPGQKAFEQFLAEFGADPLAQPETGFGTDVVQVCKRLADTLADFAGDRLKAFRGDRTKLDELATAEKAVADGRTLLPVVDRFRDKQGLNLDGQRTKYDELSKLFAAERHRLDVLAPFRRLATEPTAVGIEEFELAIRENNLTADAEAKALLIQAEKKLRASVVFAAKPIAAGRIPTSTHPPIVFASPVAGSPQPRPTLDVTPDVVFAVARGVLYALDAQTGGCIWGTRIGPQSLDPRVADVPVRVTIGDGATDWVLVTDESTERPGLTARIARTGEPVWYQQLSTPALARPVVIGGRIYLPLRDKLGTVVEFDALTGTKVGELTIRQPIGTGLAVLPGPAFGESYLVVPADAFRVFVFGIGAENADGVKLPPRCVRVFQTDHPRDSLRGEPIPVLSSEPSGPRLLVFTQADGPTGMKLRAFPLPTAGELAASDLAAVDQPTPKPAEVTVPGWAWFPPVSDGERIVLATDSGAFLAFGINQLRNSDRPLFALPGPTGGEPDAVLRSQVVSAEEDSFWAVLGGNLLRLRTTVDALAGYRIQPVPGGRPVGEPLHRAQVRPALGLGVVVTRIGTAMQAIGFDLQSGQLRWQQRLGLSAPQAPVSLGDGSALIADDDGGVYRVSPSASTGRTAAETVLADPISPPLADLAGRATAAASDDGKTLWVLAPEALDRNGKRLRIRLILDGALKLDTSVPVPEALAGSPLALGKSLLIPLANGYLHRFSPGDTQLTVGPLWRSDGVVDAVCHLAAVNDEDFLATDGGRRFVRWKWPTTAGAKPVKTAGAWEMKEKLIGPPAVIVLDAGLQFASADQSGTVFLFAGDLPGDPLRRWRGGTAIPNGSPSGLSVVVLGNRRLLLYAVDRRNLVALDPDQAEPVWVAAGLVPAEAGELTGWRVDSGRVIATEQSGRLLMFDVQTGKPFASVPQSLLGAVASGPAVPLVSGEALLTLSDGSATTVPLPPRPIIVPE